jgi:hypothetical protein
MLRAIAAGKMQSSSTTMLFVMSTAVPMAVERPTYNQPGNW